MRIVSWVATLVFLPSFAVTMLCFDVAQRVAFHVFGQRAQEHVAGTVQWLLIRVFGICGARLQLERDPAVHPWTDYLIVSNHQSMFDIAILGGIFYSNFPKYISKRELGRGIPTVSYNLRQGGHVLIDRADGASAIEAIRDLGRRVHRGGISAMIFPEGTRARRGEFGAFRPGGLLALLEEAPATPIVPVAIDESWRLLQHNYMPIPFGVRVRVRVGAPIARLPNEDPTALVARLHDEIGATLAQWRDEREARAASRR